MEVSPVQLASQFPLSPEAAPDTLGKDAFLQLLVTQLKYQDPLEPMDASQSILQTAQFTMVEKLDVIAEAVTGQQQFGQLAAVGTIVGKTATWMDDFGNARTGTILSAAVVDGNVVLNIDGDIVPASSVVSYAGGSTIPGVAPTPADPTASPASATNPLLAAPADVTSMSRTELLTGTERVYEPYDGPRKFSVGSVVGPDGKLLPDVPFYDLFVAAGTRWGVQPEVLAAMAKQESAFNLDAVSPDNAQGLMQFLPSTADWMNVDPWNPASAIDGAARYIRAEIDKFGRLDFAIAAYNAGSGAVSKYGGIPPFSETQKYVPKVLGYAGLA